MDGNLIDRIYEAASLPDLWPNLLADIARYGGGEAGVLFTVANGRQVGMWSPDIAPHMSAFVAEGWPARSDRPARILAARHSGFITDLDVYTMQEITHSPVYQEFLIPRGFGWGIGTFIPVPSGDQIFITIERAWARGPAGPAEVERMDALRPHLARAALMSARLAKEHARSMSEALALIELPACVLDVNGRTVATNGGGQALMGPTIRDGRGFALVDPAAQRLFEKAFAGMHSGQNDGPRSIPLAARHDQPPIVAHLVPVRRTARDLFGAAVAVVVFTPVVRREAAEAEILAGLFDLTAAEAKVAREISRLSTLAEIADTLKSSRETVRTQLKSVFAKTGTHRQAELAVLLNDACLSRVPRTTP